MLLKEKGYDEFLAKQLEEGRKDIEAGRVYSLDEATSHWQRTIEKKALELANLEETGYEALYG